MDWGCGQKVGLVKPPIRGSVCSPLGSYHRRNCQGSTLSLTWNVQALRFHPAAQARPAVMAFPVRMDEGVFPFFRAGYCLVENVVYQDGSRACSNRPAGNHTVKTVQDW